MSTEAVFEAYRSLSGTRGSSGKQPSPESSRELVAPAPQYFYAFMSQLPSAHLENITGVTAQDSSVFKALRGKQQALARNLDPGRAGWYKVHDVPASVDQWNATAASTVVPNADGTIVFDDNGSGKLDNEYVKIAKKRDGSFCCVCDCREPKELDAAHLLDAASRAAWREVQSIRSKGIYPVFKKDLPGNIFTLCGKHHRAFDDSRSWCLFPCAIDMEALIAYEMEDMRQRQEGLETKNEKIARTVPPTYMLSGWYEIVLLNDGIEDKPFGHYDICIDLDADVSEASQGGTIGDSAVDYQASFVQSGRKPSPRFHHDERSGALLVWLGMSDLLPYAVLLASRLRFPGMMSNLSPRFSLLRHYFDILDNLYCMQPRPRPTVPSHYRQIAAIDASHKILDIQDVRQADEIEAAIEVVAEQSWAIADDQVDESERLVENEQDELKTVTGKQTDVPCNTPEGTFAGPVQITGDLREAYTATIEALLQPELKDVRGARQWQGRVVGPAVKAYQERSREIPPAFRQWVLQARKEASLSWEILMSRMREATPPIVKAQRRRARTKRHVDLVEDTSEPSPKRVTRTCTKAAAVLATPEQSDESSTAGPSLQRKTRNTKAAKWSDTSDSAQVDALSTATGNVELTGSSTNSTSSSEAEPVTDTETLRYSDNDSDHSEYQPPGKRGKSFAAPKRGRAPGGGKANKT